MRTELPAVADDLAAEEDELASILAALDEDGWDAPTPAAGWTVRDQVAHLAEGEELASLALTDADAFAERVAALLADLDATLSAMEARGRAVPGTAVLERWERARSSTLRALRDLPPGSRVPWITGLMTGVSFATARLMETWAHGQDIADALGRRRHPTARLRHVAHLGVATRRFAFENRGLEVPPAPVVALTGPAGERWVWGDDGADERLSGPALDFCLVVTQRRHADDTDLVADGPGVRRWLAIAQAFAGPPTDGPPPAGSRR